MLGGLIPIHPIKEEPASPVAHTPPEGTKTMGILETLFEKIESNEKKHDALVRVVAERLNSINSFQDELLNMLADIRNMFDKPKKENEYIIESMRRLSNISFQLTEILALIKERKQADEKPKVSRQAPKRARKPSAKKPSASRNRSK